MSKRKSIIFGPLPPPYGGVSVFMSAIYDVAEKFDVTVWSYKGKPTNTEKNFRYVNHKRFGHLLALIREGYQARISDSTHFHFEYPNAVLLPLWLIAKLFLRFKWIKILHDGSLPSRYESFSLLQKTLFHLAIHRVDEFTVCSHELETWLRRKIHISKKVSFIPTLLPLPKNQESEKLTEEASTKLKRFSHHKKRVCSIGVFIPSYGFQQIANAVEKLREETKEDIGLLLVDGNYECDEKLREQVLKNREWIETIENVPHQNLPHIFNLCNVFVRGFVHESYGLSRIEAVWCGVPVIATNVGETRGMLVYEFNDEAALVSQLKNILFAEIVVDTKIWAETFQKEAEENLRKYMSVITGEEIKA